MSPNWLLNDSDSFLPAKIILDSIHNMLTYNFTLNPLLSFALLNQSKRYIAFLNAKLTDLEKHKRKIEEDKLAKDDTLEDKEESEEKKDQNWRPTEQWLTENKNNLPLKQILSILAHVSNRLEKAYMVYEATESEVVEILHRISIIGVQEDILKFAPLKFMLTPELENWLSQFLWKTVFLRNYLINCFIIPRIKYIQLFENINKPLQNPSEKIETPVEIKENPKEIKEPENKNIEIKKSENTEKMPENHKENS